MRKDKTNYKKKKAIYEKALKALETYNCGS